MYNRARQEQRDTFTEEQVKRVLQNSGVDIEGEVDSDFIIFCPYHNNFRTPAGEISKTSGLFFCFGCQEYRPLIDFVMHVTGKTYFQALRLIDSQKTDTDISGIIDVALEQEPEYIPFDEGLIERLHANVWESERALAYLQGEKRKLTIESIKKFQIGYSPKMDMVTVPAHSPDGKVTLGFMGRAVEGYAFKNTSFKRSRALFNLHRVRQYDKVYVVESAFDAIRLDQNGHAAVATFGAYVSKGQTELLTKNFNSVIVVGDNDDGGMIMMNKMKERIGDRAVCISVPSRFKDVGDLTDEDISKLTTRADDPLLTINY